MNPVLSFAAWFAAWLPMPAKRALYEIKPLARLIRGSLNLTVPTGFTTIEVAGGSLAGLHLNLDMKSEKDYWLGTYELDLQAAIEDVVRPGMVAYDVGANIGYISLLLAKAVGESGVVKAFEPLPHNLDRLHRNLELNPIGANVEVVEAAVVEREGMVRFLVGPSDGMGKAEGSNGRGEYPSDHFIEVCGLILDNYVYDLHNPVPQVLKMDIEGGEVLALAGMRRLLLEAPPLILLELHGRTAAEKTWHFLSGANYQICEMRSGYPSIISYEELNWKAYLIAFPPDWVWQD